MRESPIGKGFLQLPKPAGGPVLWSRDWSMPPAMARAGASTVGVASSVARGLCP
jgi:hypothetical protein